MTTEDITPEALYTHYQKNRTQRPTLSGASAAVSDTLLDRVYREYQKSRRPDREESIDAIMQLLNDSTPQETVKIDTGSVRTAREILKSLLGFPGRMLDTLVKRSALSRSALPAIAAGVLAVMLIPQLFNQSAPGYTIPKSLIDNAGVVSGYINNSENSSLGFSATGDNVKSAFELGVLSTELSIAVGTGDSGLVDAVVNRVISLGIKNSYAPLTRAAQEYQEVTRPMTLADETRMAEPQEIQMMLADTAASIDRTHWYVQGQAVESIYLAAEVAINSGETASLREALVANKTLDVTALEHPTVKIINDIRLIDAGQAPSLPDARRVLGYARNIKILMR